MHKLKTARPQAKLVQGRSDWYRIIDKLEAKAEDGGGLYAEIYIYDEIGYFGVTAQDFVRDLQGVGASKIDLHLNTPGGDVFDGIAILNALKSHSAEVTVYVDALAASIGSVIAQGGDKRIMQRNSQMMIHDGHGLAVGNAADMRELADLLDKTSNNIASVYADRAGGTVADWRALMLAETWYSAEEAVQAGLADEVGAIATGNSSENSWDLSIYNYGGRTEAPAPVQQAEPEPEFVFDAEMFRRALKEATA